MTALLLFGSTFFLVFFLGLQSLNVNGGHYTAAFFTSFAIGIANLILFKLAPNASVPEMAAYLAGGPLGIICAMRTHAWLRPKKPLRDAPTDELDVFTAVINTID